MRVLLLLDKSNTSKKLCYSKKKQNSTKYTVRTQGWCVSTESIMATAQSDSVEASPAANHQQTLPN